MRSIKARSLSTRVRSSILKLRVDAEMRLYHAEVGHHDFCPRDIILIGHDYETPDVQLKIIDFGSSTVYEHPQYAHRGRRKDPKSNEKQYTAKQLSPLVRNSGQIVDFSHLGWCPGGDSWAQSNGSGSIIVTTLDTRPSTGIRSSLMYIQNMWMTKRVRKTI
jgi:hypothetical protein